MSITIVKSDVLYWDEDIVLEHTERGEDDNHVGGVHVSTNISGVDLLENVPMYKIDNVGSWLSRFLIDRRDLCELFVDFNSTHVA